MAICNASSKIEICGSNWAGEEFSISGHTRCAHRTANATRAHRGTFNNSALVGGVDSGISFGDFCPIRRPPVKDAKVYTGDRRAGLGLQWDYRCPTLSDLGVVLWRLRAQPPQLQVVARRCSRQMSPLRAQSASLRAGSPSLQVGASALRFAARGFRAISLAG